MTAGLPTRESRGGCCGTRRTFVTAWKDTRRVNPRNLISTRALRRSIAGATLAGLLAGGAAVMPSNSNDAQAAATPIYWGAYQDAAPFHPDQIDQFETDAGKRQSIVHWGEPWQMNGSMMAFQKPQFETVRLRGSIPMIDWNSWNLGAPVNDPNYTLAKVYGGTYDAYITQWAQAAKAWGHPFFLRFDHEMNGWWQFPWAEQINGNRPGDFVKAWRHVHDIFTQQGATNVTWVWSPNIVSSNPATTALTELYPVDNYADWTAMDGYNKATDSSPSPSFNQIFGANPWSKQNTYQQLVTLAPSKPIMIAETATSVTGGDPGAWVTDALLTQLPQNFPQIKALVWFNWNGGGDSWPIETSPALQAGFRQGIASSYYATNTFSDLPFGPIQPIGGSAAAAPVPPTATAVPPTAAAVPPTATPVPPTATAGPPTATPAPATVAPLVAAPATTGSTIRVPVGGGAYTSGDGRAWQADTGYPGGAACG